MPDANPTQTDPAPLTFDERFFAQAKAFAQMAFADVPELRAVAIVPSWHVQQPHLPFGVVQGRQGNLRTAEDLFRMMTQLQGAYEFVAIRGRQLLESFDQESGKLAATIAARQAELAALQAQLAGLQPDS